MFMRRISAIVAFSIFTLTAGAAYAGPAATIDQLSWMTGSWIAPIGSNALEENWITPKDGAIAAMVRITGSGSTSMYEVIIIEEKDDSLEMSIQQWGPGFSPQSDEAQKLELTEIGEKMVKFTAITEGGMTTLGYSRPTETTFVIEMAGNPLTLTAQ